VTLHALVRDEFQGQIADSAEYFFCDAKDCDVVYFTTDGQTFTKSQLKVEVGVKEAAGERPLCYCFGHSVATIKEELRMKGRSDALEDIRQKMKDPGCACEVKNPSGSCCLGTVSRGIETAKAVINAIHEAGYRATVVETDAAGPAKTAEKPEADCCEQPPISENAKSTVQGSDPDKQIVFKVDGLRCPAVKGIGCGHMLLAENKPVVLAGDELKTALENEQWRETGRVGELSAIEFRAMTLYRIKTFAQAEKLNKETTDKLTKMAEDQWERLAQEAKKTRPLDRRTGETDARSPSPPSLPEPRKSSATSR